MSQTNTLGVAVPGGGDAFDPDGDLRRLADSLAGRIIIPVANIEERDEKVAQLGASPSRPLYVHRADAQHRLEWTEDGERWSHDGWQAWPASLSGTGTGTQWAGRYEQVGKTVRAKFRIQTSANGLGSTLTIGLPVQPHESYVDDSVAVGVAQMRRPAGSGTRTSGTLVIVGNSIFVQADRYTTATVSSNSPWSWSAGDTIGGSLEYEVA